MLVLLASSICTRLGVMSKIAVLAVLAAMAVLMASVAASVRHRTIGKRSRACLALDRSFLASQLVMDSFFLLFCFLHSQGQF